MTRTIKSKLSLIILTLALTLSSCSHEELHSEKFIVNEVQAIDETITDAQTKYKKLVQQGYIVDFDVTIGNK